MSSTHMEINALTNVETVELQSSGAGESVDLSVLTSFDEPPVEGEPDLIVELIDLYLGETMRLLTLMRDGLNAHEWDPIKKSAHSLRGSSGNLGILRMAFMSEQLEQVGFGDLSPTAAELIHSLENEFVQVRVALLLERQRRTP